MLKNVFTTAVDGRVYIISSIRRVRGLLSMPDKSTYDPGAGNRPSDAARVLESLRLLQAMNEAGATRLEIEMRLNESTVDVTAALGILQSEGLVICEGTTGYPPQACWRLKDKA